VGFESRRKPHCLELFETPKKRGLGEGVPPYWITVWEGTRHIPRKINKLLLIGVGDWGLPLQKSEKKFPAIIM